jgi:hypothetical protein
MKCPLSHRERVRVRAKKKFILLLAPSFLASCSAIPLFYLEGKLR